MGLRECWFPWKNSKVLWTILLVFASVLIVQRFDDDGYGGLADVSSRKDENCTTHPTNGSAIIADENGGKLELQIEKEGDFGLQFLAENPNGNASNFEETGRKSNLSISSSTPSSSASSVSNMTAAEAEKNVSVSVSVNNVVAAEKKWKKGTVFPVSEMRNQMFLRHSASHLPNFPKLWSSDSDEQLLNVRAHMEEEPIGKDNSGLYAPIYWNISRFKRSYEMMEQILKIYIYNEGERPVFHQPRLTGIYASEGWFMKLLQENEQFVTTNPFEAHLFYMPFSSQILEEVVYVPNSHSFDKLKKYLKNYIDTIRGRHSFWNRTSGADHFLVACHDWAPEETKAVMANCIRALCNADMGEGFQLGKDASLPETLVHSSQFPSGRRRGQLGGKPASQRRILAFFAGNMHGYVRPILLKHWENKDPGMKIVGRMLKDSYIHHMRSSKYCICARGYEVNSPRLVEAIMYGCVPVIISDNFVPPFLEVLNWEKFSIFVLEKDIPNLKSILLSISERRYSVMQHRVNQVRRHFLWHNVPLNYDLFHMVLHSIWYNRVFQMKL